jgi:hypothetical protein
VLFFVIHPNESMMGLMGNPGLKLREPEQQMHLHVAQSIG